MITTDKKNILSENLKKQLQKNKKKQSKLCIDLDIKPTTLSDWINGKTYPRIDSLEKLSHYFGITISELIEPERSDMEIDISAKLEEILILLDEKKDKSIISFKGNLLTVSTVMLIKISLENTLRLINEIVEKNPTKLKKTVDNHKRLW